MDAITTVILFLLWSMTCNHLYAYESSFPKPL